MRLSSSDPLDPVMEAILEQLATSALEPPRLRHVARHSGVSLPALLWQFRSRKALLARAVSWMQRELDELIARSLRGAHPPDEAIRALVAGLLAYIERRPALVRLLAHGAASGSAAGTHPSLGWSLALLRVVVAELVREGTLEEGRPRAVDAQHAADLLLGSTFGSTLARAAVGDRNELPEPCEPILGLWRRGIEAAASVPRDVARQTVAPAVASAARPLGRIDLREGKPGEDLAARFARAIDPVATTAFLEIVLPLHSEGLVAILERRGYRTSMHGSVDGVWGIGVHSATGPVMLDLADLPAPEPLERTLEAVARLVPGEAILARVPRFPRLLIPRLEERGLVWQGLELVDGQAVILVQRPR